MPDNIYMVERERPDPDAPAPLRYRRVSRAVTLKPVYVFEGVDGDEEADTVTYWFRRRTEEE
jgi:hypothetical protein